jgi:hypothetical protein
MMLLPYFSIICNAWHAAAQGIIPHQLKDLGCSIQHHMSLYRCTAAGEIYIMMMEASSSQQRRQQMI